MKTVTSSGSEVQREQSRDEKSNRSVIGLSDYFVAGMFRVVECSFAHYKDGYALNPSIKKKLVQTGDFV